MAEIVNLRTRRKQLARAAAGRDAAQNRARHGRTRAERQATETAKDRESRSLDRHILSGDGEGPER